MIKKIFLIIIVISAFLSFTSCATYMRLIQHAPNRDKITISIGPSAEGVNIVVVEIKGKQEKILYEADEEDIIKITNAKPGKFFGFRKYVATLTREGDEPLVVEFGGKSLAWLDLYWGTWWLTLLGPGIDLMTGKAVKWGGPIVISGEGSAFGGFVGGYKYGNFFTARYNIYYPKSGSTN